MKVKPRATIVKRWIANLSGAIETIKTGVEATTDEWLNGIKASEAAYKEGVTATGIEKRRTKGAEKVGSAKWKEMMLLVGIDRIKTGVENKSKYYEAGIDPYLTELERLTLPARKAAGSPDNIKRVTTITDALHKLKLKLLGG
jgi:hypothetical protein